MPHYPNTSGQENLLLLCLIYLHRFHHVSYSSHPSNLSEASCRVLSKWVSWSHLYMHHTWGVHTFPKQKLWHSRWFCVSQQSSNTFFHCVLSACCKYPDWCSIQSVRADRKNGQRSVLCCVPQGETFYSSKVFAAISLS